MATFIGIAVLVFYAFTAAVGWKRLARPEAARKTCPDCANSVLAAARKRQHCGYRFSD